MTDHQFNQPGSTQGVGFPMTLATLLPVVGNCQADTIGVGEAGCSLVRSVYGIAFASVAAMPAPRSWAATAATSAGVSTLRQRRCKGHQVGLGARWAEHISKVAEYSQLFILRKILDVFCVK